MKKTIKGILCLVITAVMLSCGMFAFAECGDVKVIMSNTQLPGLSQGINICTGSDAPYTFEGDTDEMIVSSPTGDNKVLKLGEWDRGRIDFANPIEAQRPVQLSFDYYSEGGTIGIRLNDYQNNELSNVFDYFATRNNVWERYSVTVALADKNAQGRFSPAWQGLADDTLDKIFIKIWGTEVKYIDNVSAVPYYKVTYLANDGTDTVVATDYFLADIYKPGVNITAPMREGYKLVGWALSEDGKAVQSITTVVGKDIELYAVWAEQPAEAEQITENLESVAGINLWTGDTAPDSFENNTHSMVVASPTDENNKVLKFEGWQSAGSSSDLGIEAERPVEFSFDYYSTGGTLSIRLNQAGQTELSNVWDYFVTDNNTWARYSTKIVASEKNPDGRQKTAWSGLGGGTLDDIIIKVWGNETKHIDNVSAIPYYKATYYANDGTDSILATDYFLAASYTPGANISIPVKEGYKLAGWSITPDGKAKQMLATTPGRDIALYAVWEEIKPDETQPSPELDSDAGLNLWTGNTSPFTFDDNLCVSPTDENNGVLKLEAWRYTAFDSGCSIEAHRPVELSFDYYSEGGTLSVRLNQAGQSELANVWDYFVTQNNTWSRYSTKIVAADKNPNGRQNPAWSGSVAETLYNVYLQNWGTGVKYIDNLSVIPYYKVTYYANDTTDTVVATDYFLAESYKPGTRITTPLRKGYNFKGWAKTPSGQPVDIVTAEVGKDIALYAVWEKHITSGECGQYVTWSFDYDGTLTITGKRGMYPLSSITPWDTVKGLIKKVVVKERVENIPDFAFADCVNLTTVIIPDSVKSIGDDAFNNCKKLKTVCYTGNDEEWNIISLGENNLSLTNANIIKEYVPDVAATYTIVNKDGDITVCSVFCQNIPSASGIFVCVFESGELVHMEIRLAGNSEYENFYFTQDADNVKIFVFDAEIVLKPLTVSESIDV